MLDAIRPDVLVKGGTYQPHEVVGREIVEQYGGRYVVIGGTCDVIEGQWKPNFPVIIRFPNLEQAHNWYHSEEYKYLKALRLSGSKCDAVFMESASGEFVSES